ncbi:hypothetical protein GXP70_12455 [Paenibacillus lycopersici]|uniref:Carbohydrate-binding protein CenC n=1 Tax=Paenibacillus lycopersici TaxID=2704462 RepID=A0A6C0FX97_9BACL|nr:hypothetical protein [Paenibacillus lycopersici]QHT60672.1 hypothetical protein GXP70_12455 [Paenibacillus lycopersici]
MPLTFTPPDGYRNKTSFPTTPTSEDAFRDSMQSLLDQMRDYINNNLALTAGPTMGLSRQAIINGNFNIWQRGTSFTSLNGFSADRWSIQYDGTLTADVTRRSFAPGQTEVPNEPNYCLRITVTNAGTGTRVGISQRIEDVRTFAGKKVTHTFWIRSNRAGLNVRRDIFIQNFGSAGSTQVSVTTGQAETLAANVWTPITITSTIPSIAGKTVGDNSYLSFEVRCLNPQTGDVIDIAQVSLNEGSAALPFQARNIADELALCLRYYEKSYAYGTVPGTAVSNGCVQSTSLSSFLLSRNDVGFRVNKRVQPTMTIYSTQNGAVGSSTEITSSGTFVADRVVTTTAVESSFSVGGAAGNFTANNFQRFHWTADAEL